MKMNTNSRKDKLFKLIGIYAALILFIIPIALYATIGSAFADSTIASAVAITATDVKVKLTIPTEYGRKSDFTGMDSNTYSYQKYTETVRNGRNVRTYSNIVTFNVELITNKDDGGDYTVLGNDNPITVSYYTYDLTAVASTGDYTAVKGTVTFPAGSKNGDIKTIQVKVNPCDLGIYRSRTKSVYGSNFTSTYRTFYPYKSVNTTPERVGYLTRYFGVHIDVASGNAKVASTYSSNKTTYYNEAMGMIPANSLIPAESTTNGYVIGYYFCMDTVSLSDITELGDTVKYTKSNIKSTTYGTAISESIIQSGIGHYYVSGYFKIDGKDKWQNDSGVGLCYEGSDTMTLGSNASSDKFKSARKVGMVAIEMDGYPDGEEFNFGGYRNKALDGKDDDDYEYSEKSGIFEEYCSEYDGKYHAYRVQGDPSWIGMAAWRDSHGDKRKVYDAKLYITVRDDSPLVVKDVYIENTTLSTSNDYIVKTNKDCLRIMVRLNEPAQVSTTVKDQPVLKAQLWDNNTGTAVNFTYETGSGTDTLVFKLDLSTLEANNISKNITKIKVVGFSNVGSVTDFSSEDMIRKSNGNSCDNGKNSDWGLYEYKSTSFDEKQSGTHWTLSGFINAKKVAAKFSTSGTGDNKVYGFDGGTYDLDAAIDTRKPTISSVDCSTAKSGTASQKHDIVVTIDSGGTGASTMDMTLYYAWTDDIVAMGNNGEELDVNAAITKPAAYYSKASPTQNNRFSITGSRTGTRFLWIKGCTAFGAEEEQLCGPFYFDNEVDNVTDITVDNQLSPTNTKKVSFTIDHSTDYRSFSATDSDMKVSKIALLWQTYAPWKNGSDLNYTEIYAAGTQSTRKITVTENKVKYNALSFKSVSSTNKSVSLSDFLQFDNENSGVIVTKEFTTSITYTFDIGYLKDDTYNFDDFGLASSYYNKVYIGFVVWDGIGNAKNYKDSNIGAILLENKDYKSDTTTKGTDGLAKVETGSLVFDIRSILGATFSTNAASITSGFGNEYAFYGSKQSIQFTITLDEPIDKSVFSSGTSVQAVVFKPNTNYNSKTKLADIDSKITGSVNDDNRYYSNQFTKVADTDVYYTPWFSWHMVEGKKKDGSLTGKIDKIILNTYIYDSVKYNDIYGYYNVSFTIKSTGEKSTKSLEFYLGADYNAGSTVEKNQTRNYTALTDGSVMTNRVYQLIEGSQFVYYNAETGSIVREPYAKNGKLTFSSYDVAYEYIQYMEYQDLSLYYVDDDQTAASLEAGSGNMRKATGETTKVAKGQYWIRYKNSGWTSSSTSTADWVYYYFNTIGGDINVDTNISTNLGEAIKSVVTRILYNVDNETAKDRNLYTILTSDGGLDANGAPYVNPAWIRYNAETTNETRNGDALKNATYGGDFAIYNSLLDIEGKNYVLASAQVLDFSNYSNIYIMCLEDNSNLYCKISLGSKSALKNVVDEVATRITQSDSRGTSGRYKILELDENGFNEYYVYIDKDAPQFNFVYSIYTKQGDGYVSSVYDLKTSTSGSDADHTINATSFTIKGLGKIGAADSVNAVAEIDEMSYVAVWNRSKSKLLYTYTYSDLLTQNIVLQEGTYAIEVYDRSGNNYTEYVNINTSVMTVDVRDDTNLIIRVNNRSEEEIKSFVLSLDGEVITTTFFEAKTFQDSGLYSLAITDIYGIEYTGTVNFQRKVPDVIWKYEEGMSFVLVNETNKRAVVQQSTSTKSYVVTSEKVAFSVTAMDNIKVTLVDTEESAFIVTSGQYITYSQKEKGSFTVTFAYADFPDSQITYYVLLDETPPQIQISYDQYEFEQLEQTDAALQVLEAAKASRAFVDGELVIPRRIDYASATITTLYATPGSSISTNSARITLTDMAGISSFIIQLNGETIYNGEYHEDGKYTVTYKEYSETLRKQVEKTKVVNFNELTDFGSYTITAFDSLLNKSTISFTLCPGADISCYVDGELYTPVVQYTYKKDKNGEYIVENGEKVIEAQWYYMLNFEVVGNEEDGLTGNYSKEDSEYYVRNSQEYTSVQYGNTSQRITLIQDVDIRYLLTCGDSKAYLGLKYEGGMLYVYEYHAQTIIEDVLDNDGNPVKHEEYTLYDSLSDVVFDALSAVVGATEVVYSFIVPVDSYHSEMVALTAWKDRNGYLNLSISALETVNTVLTIEAKISSPDGSFEPVYFKTMLSKVQSSISVTVDGMELDVRAVKDKETYFTNGSHLNVLLDEEHLDSAISTIKIAYDPKVLSFSKYYYIFKLNEEIPEEELYVRLVGDVAIYAISGDGYYSIEVENVYGNTKTYYFSVSNELGVLTRISNRDGFTAQYDANYKDSISSNGTIVVTFRNDSDTTYKVYDSKGNETSTFTVEPSAASVSLTFEYMGEYKVVVQDNFGNMVVREISINYNKDFDVPDNLIIGYDLNAKYRLAGYTAKKLSIDGSGLEACGVKYVSVKFGENETVVFNEISMSGYGRITLAKANFTDCIGNESENGVYTIIFKDKSGNIAEKTIMYRSVSTLILTRMTSALTRSEEIDVNFAVSNGLWSNSSLTFSTVSSSYSFTIDDREVQCPKDLLFSSTVTEGKIEYDIGYHDEYGFEHHFKAYLYRTTLSVAPSESTSIITVEGDFYTTKPFSMVFSNDSTCSYTFNGETFTYERDAVIKKDGKYAFKVEDLAGNAAYYNVIKDSVVYYEFRQGQDGSLVRKGFVVSANSVTFMPLNEDTSFIKKAFLNGNEVTDFTNTLSKAGKWELVVADAVGNESNFMFYIISHALSYFDFYAPQDYEITEVWFDAATEGSAKISVTSRIDKTENGEAHFVFNEDGNYMVVINSKITGQSSTFSVDITSKRPEAALDVENGAETIKDVVLSNNEVGDTVYVYIDGKLSATHEISYNKEPITFTEPGEYRIVVYNEAGNMAEFNFVKKRVPNTAGSVLIIIGVVAVVAGLFIGLLYRNKSKVDK